MSDESHLGVPTSFLALFVEPGRIKPNVPCEYILQRYELCEDLAAMLVDHAKIKRWELGITEADVLVRIHRGLLQPGTGVNAVEAGWVTMRLAELLEWECPPLSTG